MPYALVLFIVMPIVEIALLLRVGDALGWLPTLAIVILTAILGSAMLRYQGLATLNTARQRLDSGEMPAQQLLEGLFIMVGGLLLLTPGFVTDTFGFLCLIPGSRQWLASKISVRVLGGMASAPGAGSPASGRAASGRAGSAGPDGSQPGTASRPQGRSGEIIDGDFKRIDED